MKCKHEKIYSDVSETLTCIPPVHIMKWVCKKCGEEGEDRDMGIVSEYESIKEKFDKKK